MKIMESLKQIGNVLSVIYYDRDRHEENISFYQNGIYCNLKFRALKKDHYVRG